MIELDGIRRLRVVRHRPIDARGSHVLYWMTSVRRTRYNSALERAAQVARELGLPLVVLESLRVDYPFACARFHSFVVQGMADNRDAFARVGAAYHPYVEPRAGADRGLLAELARGAALVVGDAYPTGFLRSMVERALEALDVRTEIADGIGVLPVNASLRPFQRAVDFRRFVQRTAPWWIARFPQREPLKGPPLANGDTILARVTTRWPAAAGDLLAADPKALARLPIDHTVMPTSLHGGSRAAGAQLDRFVEHSIDAYADSRLDLRDDAASRLSPYLHFGHLSPHEVLDRIFARVGFEPSDFVPPPARGAKEGYWDLPPSIEAFIDQLVVWRELGHQFCAHVQDPCSFESLPAWARRTLESHVADPRPVLYDLESLDSAATTDDVWNRAQRQLVTEGRIQNYLRMLWGKRVIEWTEHPREAMARLFHLNDRYALDGRDPNTMSGVTWCFGRFDRPWAPERPIYGRIRYMSSENTRRKLKLSRRG